MNKLMKLASLLIAGMALTSCGMFEDDDYVGGDFEKLVQRGQKKRV